MILIWKEVLVMMYKSGFSNYPVYHNGMLVGVANAGRITKMLGQKIYNKEDIKLLKEALRLLSARYVMSKEDDEAQVVVRIFTEYANGKSSIQISENKVILNANARMVCDRILTVGNEQDIADE